MIQLEPGPVGEMGSMSQYALAGQPQYSMHAHPEGTHPPDQQLPSACRAHGGPRSPWNMVDSREYRGRGGGRYNGRVQVGRGMVEGYGA